MLNDYKPTHDPNIDTFKVQYLLGGSAVLAVLFPYRYEIAEVSYPLRHARLRLSTGSCEISVLTSLRKDSMGLFNMA